MASFEAKWNELRASTSDTEEKARAEALAAVVREQGVVYQVAVFDAASGAAIPVTDLGRHPTSSLTVRLTVDGKSVPDWQPRNAHNVEPLLRQ